MVIAVTVGDIPAAAVVEFDFETMTDVAGVIDGIEVVYGSVGDARLDVVAGENKQASGAADL